MPQSRAHDEDRSATTTDTIDNPEDAQANKDQLADKQEEADGAEDEEEEEVPDVSLPLVAALARACRAPVSTRHLADPLSALPRPQQGDEIREGAHLVLPPLSAPSIGAVVRHTSARADPDERTWSTQRAATPRCARSSSTTLRSAESASRQATPSSRARPASRSSVRSRSHPAGPATTRKRGRARGATTTSDSARLNGSCGGGAPRLTLGTARVVQTRRVRHADTFSAHRSPLHALRRGMRACPRSDSFPTVPPSLTSPGPACDKQAAPKIFAALK